jgi:lysozyme family protein
MGFSTAITLWSLLEGRTLTDDPIPSWGGVTKATWEAYCERYGRAFYWPLHPEDVASVLYSLWNQFHCDALPEPADAVFLQLAGNLRPQAAAQILQLALDTQPDGVIGPATLARTRLYHGNDLTNSLLRLQRLYYITKHPWGSEELKGLLNRTRRVEEFLATGTIQS